MRTPLGSTGLSASGGTVELVGRRGGGWRPIAQHPMPLAEAIALLDTDDHRRAHADEAFDDALPADAADAPVFAPGDELLWRYGKHIEAARVVHDDEQGLVAWIPSGSQRLESVPADGRRPRDVTLEERFSVPWAIAESTWRGPGVLRAAPAGRPWSIWFFRRVDGSPDGAYINIELPHRRLDGAPSSVFSRDLVLDLWIDAEHPGEEDVWLKDADELAAAVAQGRFTEAQAEAVRSIADHAGHELVDESGWPFGTGWESWTPSAEMDVPVLLPATRTIEAARARSGRTSLEG